MYLDRGAYFVIKYPPELLKLPGSLSTTPSVALLSLPPRHHPRLLAVPLAAGTYGNVSTHSNIRSTATYLQKIGGVASTSFTQRDNPGLPNQKACPTHPRISNPSTAHQSQVPPTTKADKLSSAIQNRQALSFDTNSRWVPSWTPNSFLDSGGRKVRSDWQCVLMGEFSPLLMIFCCFTACIDIIASVS